MKKLLILSTLLFTLFTFTNSAYSQSIGAWSCGQIIQFERDNFKVQLGHVSLWFAGYIWGRNAAEKVHKFPNADGPTLFYMLSSYCKKHPTLQSYEAAERIYDEKR